MTIEEFLADVIADFRERDEWDQEPTLALLARREDDRLIGLMAFPPFVWEVAGHPRRALQMLTNVIGQSDIPTPDLPDGHTLVGLVLVSEGYGIKEPKARPDGYWDTHRIADDPDGYELVSALAVDLEGTAYGHMYRRGAEETDDQPDALTAGALIDCMRDLLEAWRSRTVSA